MRRFSSSRRHWDSPNPTPGSVGRGTLAGERGVGRVPIPTRGHTLHVVLFIYTYFVNKSKMPMRGRVVSKMYGCVCDQLIEVGRGDMKQIFDVEGKPFTSSLYIYPEACC